MVATDLDSMLAESELRDTKAAFWKRYHLKFPAEVHPADATLSRVAREMSKRMLCVFNVWKVRSLQFQLHTTNRKRKLGDNLYTEDLEEEDAMAGTSAVAPPPGTDEGLGADTTKFVEVPLDVVLAYFYRAKRTAGQLPHGKRLSWLQRRDAEERAEWVSRFRESHDTLGHVIKETMVARDPIKQHAAYLLSDHMPVSIIRCSWGRCQCKLRHGFSRMEPPPRSARDWISSSTNEHALLSVATLAASAWPRLGNPSGYSSDLNGCGAGLPLSKTRGISLALLFVQQSMAAQIKSA